MSIFTPILWRRRQRVHLIRPYVYQTARHWVRVAVKQFTRAGKVLDSNLGHEASRIIPQFLQKYSVALPRLCKDRFLPYSFQFIDYSIIQHYIHCEFGIEPSGSMKCWGTIEWPSI
jgi:hypothetical protein